MKAPRFGFDKPCRSMIRHSLPSVLRSVDLSHRKRRTASIRCTIPAGRNMTEDQGKSQNTHYLPEWLLWKFRQPALYELDIFTGRSAQRKPKKAGSAPDLWPADIEHGLSIHDNEAARIYRNRIHEKERIVLSASERRDFARWLAQFFVRVPTTLENIRHLLEQEKKNPVIAIKAMYKSRAHILKTIHDRNPQLYDETVKELGKANVEDFLLGNIAQQIAGSKLIRWPRHEEIYQRLMRNNSSEYFARRLCDYDWQWLHSRHGFVIGDNPLIRWDVRRQKWNCGIDNSGIQITMPLGLNLCLLLNQGHRLDCNYLLDCNKQDTRAYNCRQRLAAIKYVYGNSPEVLDF